MQYFGYKNLAALAFLAAIVFFISTHYLDAQQKKLNTTLLEEITLQEQKVYQIAEAVKTGKPTEPLSRFIADCSTNNRNQFDNSLDKLATLTPKQIEDLEPLFDACADFFANAKSGLVYQLENELYYLEKLSNLSVVVDQAKVLSAPLSSWQEYLALEKQLAEALQKQVEIQSRIMSLLKDGKSTNDANVKSLVQEARQLSEQASVTTKQRDAVFVTLTP